MRRKYVCGCFAAPRFISLTYLNAPISLQLFSTLLYLSLMMHKIDEIKVLLKESDPSTYVSNQMIFDSLRSPNFHLQRHHER